MGRWMFKNRKTARKAGKEDMEDRGKGKIGRWKKDMWILRMNRKKEGRET